MDKYTGLLTKIRLIREKPILVRFTLVTESASINCLVARDMLARQVLVLPDDKYVLRVKGHFNNKDQLVIRWLSVNNGDNYTRGLGL